MYGRDDGEGTLVDAYDIIDAISDAPAADVVEVVRCGQCFYSAHDGRRIGVVDDNSDT